MKFYQKLYLRDVFEIKDIKIPIEITVNSSEIKNIDKGLDLDYLKNFTSNSEVGIIHAPFDGLSISTEDNTIREYSLKNIMGAIDLASILGAKKVIFHSGIREQGERKYKTLLNSMEELKKYSKKKKVKILLENTYETIDIFKKLIQDTDLEFCFDIGHSNCFSKSQIDDWINTLYKRIGHLHLHDNNGNIDQHLSLGKGNIDFNKISGLILEDIDITFETSLNDYEKNKDFILKLKSKKV